MSGLRAGRAARRWLPWLMLSVMLAAWLGALHPIVHLHSHAGAQHSHATGSLKDLMGDHGSASDCLVFDQVHHGDALPAEPPLGLSQLCPDRVQWAGRTMEGKAPRLAFQARAPPAIRSHA